MGCSKSTMITGLRNVDKQIIIQIYINSLEFIEIMAYYCMSLWFAILLVMKWLIKYRHTDLSCA